MMFAGRQSQFKRERGSLMLMGVSHILRAFDRRSFMEDSEYLVIYIYSVLTIKITIYL